MKAFLIAGEPSGDKLGGALMAGLKDLRPDISFDGVGGREMETQGLTSLFPMEELSVMGLIEILPRYRALMRRIEETAAAVIASRPDVLITIDSPDFCLRVAKRVRAAAPEIRTVHYVAPSVWAWRKGRAVKMARHIDQVLALLPFEPPFMEAAGMRCDFVGHPVVAEPIPTRESCAALRKELGLEDKEQVLLVLPGSRKGEVSRLSNVFGEVVARLVAKHPDLRILVPAAGPVAEIVKDAAKNWAGNPI
ncbi:MAG: lipid-A-disaccharide synthase, partial [Paracoccaceae bacterium]|nr:lipid-A-disaccharide synthase [Paracoccaceae bacterium]